MPSHNNESLWGNVNTCFEIGIEIAKLMEKNGKSKGVSGDSKVERIADGVLLMSDDKTVLIAVSKTIAAGALSDKVREYGKEKDGYLCYGGALSAIPLYELSQNNENVRDYIISEESLRATLCGNYPEYVKSHNMAAAPKAQIKDADAPLYMFLQKQLDLAADSTHAEVAEFQVAHAHEAAENGLTDDVLEMER